MLLYQVILYQVIQILYWKISEFEERTENTLIAEKG